MSPWDGLNRRKFPRVMCPCLVTIRKGYDRRDDVLTHTENLGIGGVCVILKQSLKMFTEVDVEIDLLDLEASVKCKGKVVWAVRRKESSPKKPMFYDTGIEFLGLSEGDHKRVEVLIDRLVKKGKSSPYT